jgi:predicted TIM-barrel fold metal-dependent hydrolase
MTTVDMHVHLLSSKVAFDRIYDKLALRIIGRSFGIDLQLAKSDPYEAYTQALIENVKNSEHISKIALFGVDAKFDDSGNEIHRDKTVSASNEDVYEIYKKHPDLVIPFFSINPKRKDALDLIDKYTEFGFKGAKFLQNYWAVDTREKRYIPYFRKLYEKNIPLIVHIGSESSVASEKSCETIEMLNGPLREGVNTIAAHMALSYDLFTIYRSFSKDPSKFNTEYFVLLEMLKKHQNLYADISALLTPVRAKVLPHLSKQEDIHGKLLFGTDFPVPFNTIFTSYDLSLKKRVELNRVPNPFDRYAKAVLEYFPPHSEIYNNWQKLLS